MVVFVVKPMMNVVVNNVDLPRTLVLRIERSDGVAPYEAKYKGLFMIGNIPDEGSVIRLQRLSDLHRRAASSTVTARPRARPCTAA